LAEATAATAAVVHSQVTFLVGKLALRKRDPTNKSTAKKMMKISTSFLLW